MRNELTLINYLRAIENMAVYPTFNLYLAHNYYNSFRGFYKSPFQDNLMNWNKNEKFPYPIEYKGHATLLW